MIKPAPESTERMNPIGDKLEDFLASRSYQPTTVNQYRYLLQRLAGWLQSQGTDFDHLDTAAWRYFVSSQGWGDNLQRQALSALRAYLRYLSMSNHPIFTLKLPPDRPAPQRTPTLDQLDRLLQSLDTSRPTGRRNLAIVALMLETGLRSAEVCRLELKRLDLTNRCLSVIAKGGQWRSALYSGYTTACLESWLATRLEIAPPTVRTVFVGVGGLHPGQPLTTAGLRCIFRAMGKRAGLPGLSPHDLRRAMACEYISAGVPTRIVQVLGAWSDIRLVERYTRQLTIHAQSVEDGSPVLAALRFRWPGNAS